MSSDKIIELLLEEYPEQITEFILNCYTPAHNGLDVAGLNSRLQSLRIDQASLSLSEDEWYELIYELTPDVYDSMFYGRIAA